jgi:two-component system chemotaxis sensor kinase CheA
LSISLVRRAGRLVFACEDDGAGIDFAAVRRIARERNVPGADGLDEDGLMALLLRGGISTAGSVTEVSGRGIGLDVVRAGLEQLGGTLHMSSAPGRFTRFELGVPLSVVGLDVLLVSAAGHTLAIPMDTVHGTLRIAAGDIIWGPAGGAVRFGAATLPFVALPWLLYQQPTPPGQSGAALAVEGAVLGVDRLLGTMLVAARPLPPFTPASPFVVGATLDAEGNPLLLLDTAGLAAAARQASPMQIVVSQAPVLIVDDSLTTRMLEQSILESAGYTVDTASSAEAGLAAARVKSYRLFMVDVEMPGMDGFGFVETIRADPALRDIPAILVTSRAAPEDRARGLAAGANFYVDKSRFDQIELLRMIRGLLGEA